MQPPPTSEPLISIGMPVFNCSATIASAIRSIVGQSFQNWELIILDDGSTDATTKIAASFDDPRIVIERSTQNLGLPARLNECVARSRGQFFARMDGDDIAYPTRLERQVAFLQENPKIDLVGGWMVVFRDDGTAFGARRGPLIHEEICAHPWTGFHLAHPTWMGRVDWFRRYPYRSDAVRMEDQDLLFRTYRSSRFAALPEVMLAYREDSLSLRKLLLSRKNLCKLLFQKGYELHQFGNAAIGILAHAAKGLVDAVAICTGLNYHLLRHRAVPIHHDEEIRWFSVRDQFWSAPGQRCMDLDVPAVDPENNRSRD